MHVWFSKHLPLFSGHTPDRLCRLVDDVFFVWTHGEDELLKFHEFLNTTHHSIKFDIEYSRSEVHFLDVVIRRSCQHLYTDLYVKPTDKKQYLHYTSCHPKHVIKAIPYSQAVRYRRNICLDSDLKAHINNLKEAFASRGYQDVILNHEIDKIFKIDRKSTLRYTTKEDRQQRFLTLLKGRTFLPCIIVFHNQLEENLVKNVMMNRWKELLDSNIETFEVFSNEFPLMVYKRGRTLKNIVAKSCFKGTADPTIYLLKEMLRNDL